MQLSCTSFTCVFLCVYDKVGVLLILLIFSFHVTSYWCLSAIIKDTKECTVINDCSLMTFSCNSEGGWVGLCTALIGQLGCYVASFQPSSLQANGCCACVGLLEGLSLPLLRVLRNLHCMLSVCEQAGWHISSAVCVCVHLMCQYCFPFLQSLSSPALHCSSLTSRCHALLAQLYPNTWQVGRGGWSSSGVCSSSGTHAHNTHTHTSTIKGHAVLQLRH